MKRPRKEQATRKKKDKKKWRKDFVAKLFHWKNKTGEGGGDRGGGRERTQVRFPKTCTDRGKKTKGNFHPFSGGTVGKKKKKNKPGGKGGGDHNEANVEGKMQKRPHSPR